MTKTLRLETRSLPSKLDDEELRARVDELAVCVQPVNSEDESQTNLKAQMKSSLADMKAGRFRRVA